MAQRAQGREVELALLWQGRRFAGLGSLADLLRLQNPFEYLPLPVSAISIPSFGTLLRLRPLLLLVVTDSAYV